MNPFTKKTTIRPPAMADRFYPASQARLTKLIHDCILTSSAWKTGDGNPKAVIAPHAGYIYSGPIAASALAPFKSEKERIRRIVLIGPSHRVAFQGLAVPSSEAFATPLGAIPIDTVACKGLRTLSQVQVLDEVHAQEHSLEVELPFLQVLLNEFSLVPIVVGEATGPEIADAIELVWGGNETRFVISSDLSHYLPYEDAVKRDRATADAIESMQPDCIHENQACGRAPVIGMLIAARRRNLHAVTVDLRNSGDTAGSKDRVVGYGAFAFA